MHDDVAKKKKKEKIVTSKRWHDQDWLHAGIISQEVLHWWEQYFI